MTKENIDNTKMIQELGKQTILDENGTKILMSSLWEQQRTALIFVRHFG
ncbi:MAG: hypothetical protein HQK76_12795 [Desulfobacterales bacterium]|nr:hypothetical protein [Desulfobacterales bacterium]